MFLFWLFIAIAFGIAEEIGISYDAYKYHKNGGFYGQHPELKRWNQQNKK